MRKDRRRTATLLMLAMSLAVPALAKEAPAWEKTSASGINDVAVAPDGTVWLAGGNGSVWTSSDDGKTFRKVKAEGFRRLSVGRDNKVWAVGANGTLWTRTGAAWKLTTASGILDVSATDPSGRVWLAGKNGSVWYTIDGGQSFAKIEASGMCRVAAASAVLYGVGCNGTLWRYANAKWTKTAASGIGDAAAGGRSVWLAGKNGTVWTLTGATFAQQPGEGFDSIAAAPGNAVWAVGKNQTLWVRR